jgi:hypothetical protein
MKKLIFLVCLLFISCATTKSIVNEQPLKYSYLPPKLDLDLLMPVVKNVVDSSLQDFESIPIDSGKLITIYKDTLKLHPGILISEKKAALLIYYKSSSEYLDKKAKLTNKLYSEYYDRSVDAEKIYQEEIKNLRKQTERNWIEKNIVYFGFVAGLATAILTEFAVIQGQK